MRFFIFFFVFFLNSLNADEIEIRSNTITKNLRCLVCEGKSVYESNSNFANDIKNFVKNEIKENKKDEEIYKFLKAKYGEAIIFNPLPSTKNIILWIGPVLFFLIGIFVIYRRLNVQK